MGWDVKMLEYFEDKGDRFIFLVLSFIVLLIYAQTINYAYNLDDQLVYHNMPQTSNISEGLKQIFSNRFAFKDYRPVSISTFYFEYLLLGEINPNFSHLINIIFYIFLCNLIYIFIRKLNIFKFKYQSLFSTIIFLIHPIHNSVVSNIKNRDNILSMTISVFIMILFILIIRNKKYLLLPLLLPFFALAIWCKLDAIFLVIIIPLILYYERGDIKRAVTLIPSILLIILLLNFYFLIFYLVDNNLNEINNIYTVDNITENPFIHDFTWNNRIKLIGVTYLQYLKFFLIPFNYRFYYGSGFLDVSHVMTPTNILGWLCLLGTIFSIILFTIKKHRMGVSISLLFVPLIYCINFFQPVPGLFADRYAFISSLGFSIIVVMIIELLFKKNSFAMLFCIGYFIVLFIFSFLGVQKWRNYDTLFNNDMPYLNHVYEPNRIAASTYLDLSSNVRNSDERNDFLNKAIKYAKQGFSLYKGDNFMCQLAGTAYYLQGDFSNSFDCFSEALKINPNDNKARMSLADLSIEMNDYENALKNYNIAFSANYYEDQIAYKIVDAYCKISDYRKADSINEIIKDKVKPKYIYFENKGYIFLSRNDSVQAFHNFENAISMGLNDPKLDEEILIFKHRHLIQ